MGFSVCLFVCFETHTVFPMQVHFKLAHLNAVVFFFFPRFKSTEEDASLMHACLRMGSVCAKDC